jgi:hypothetical protein
MFSLPTTQVSAPLFYSDHLRPALVRILCYVFYSFLHVSSSFHSSFRPTDGRQKSSTRAVLHTFNYLKEALWNTQIGSYRKIESKIYVCGLGLLKSGGSFPLDALLDYGVVESNQTSLKYSRDMYWTRTKFLRHFIWRHRSRLQRSQYMLNYQAKNK